MLLWLTLLLSFIYSNFGVTYYGSRRIYPHTSTAPLCSDYIEVTFEFDDTTTQVIINIMSTTNTAWFSVGFPSPTLYYDKSKRKSDLMNGYALVYMNGNISEYTIAATDNIIHTMTNHSAQNIIINDLNNTGGDVKITITRNLTTDDANDFVFDMASYVECYPLLMTVAIGDGLTLGSDNSFGSSYLYFYDKTLRSDQTEYPRNWNVSLTPTSPNYINVPMTVSLTMDPASEIVSVEVKDGPTATAAERAWALSFPDLADVAYYHPEDTDPIGMETDYAIFWGHPTATSGCGGFIGFAHDTVFTEARVPVNGAECSGLGSYSDCWDILPNQKLSTPGFSEAAGVDTYTFDLQFKSCGYEFTPYEYQTCRPLTMVAVGAMTASSCVSAFDDDSSGVHHNTDKIQIDGFPTRHPTAAPSGSPSLPPSNAPTASPSLAPSHSPVSPSVSPTYQTLAPTLAPSWSPTPKPSPLPTKHQLRLDYPPCDGLQVKHLELLFPEVQAVEEFNAEVMYYNGRRVWNNGRGLLIHFVNRFVDGGDWVISNGSYSAISIIDSNFNNSLAYNTSDPNAISPNALPGPYSDGYVYYDHFAHDNILSKPDAAVTLYFACMNTSYPTAAPSPQPTTATPTMAPFTATPTMAPTANCSGLCINRIKVDKCGGDISQLFVGCYNKQQSEIDSRAVWLGVEDVSGYIIYHSEFHERWIITSDDDKYAAFTEGTQRYPPGLDDYIGPPLTEEWTVINHDSVLADPCSIHFKYFCFGTARPTFRPTASPTTAIPTTAAPSPDPTTAPSLAPTSPPTLAPSLAPTIAPTGSPIMDCKGLRLNGTDVLDGLYRQEVGKKLVGRDYWNQVHGDAQIFWSDSVLHESWVINSMQLQRYWLSNRRPPLQPPLESDWSLYEGAQPFIQDTKPLVLKCFSTLPPTPYPTIAPSSAPTKAPLAEPSNAPSAAPTDAPSLAPSVAPTPTPTTQSPTIEPTLNPTAVPTADPTAEPCDFMVINSNIGTAQVDKYSGVYHHQNFGSDAWRMDKTDGSGHWFILTKSNDLWSINTNDGSGLTLTIPGSMKRPPFDATHWQFPTDPSKLNYTLSIICSMTSVPTTEPTAAPSMAPTGAPTSSCRGLQFVNEDDVDFKFNGWYYRKDNFAINGHKYWQMGTVATIEYVNDAWYLMEKDNDLLDDEDPVMLIVEGSDLLSPPSGVWTYADRAVDSTATVTITCVSTSRPSTDPSPAPSRPPTVYVMPSWKLCPDWKPYFTIVTRNTSSVYWPLPTLNDHLYDLDVTVSPMDAAPGDEMAPGKYVFAYTAVDTKNVSIGCNVTLYVIHGWRWSSSYIYCTQLSSKVGLRFNDSYYELASDQEDTSGGTDIEGNIYDPDLQLDGQWCNVFAQQISNYGTVHIDDSPPKSSFFGLETYSLTWEIIIVVFVVIVQCLIIHCLYGIYRDRKNAAKQDREQRESLLEAHQLSSREEQNPEEAQDGGDIELQKPAQPQPVADIEDDASDD